MNDKPKRYITEYHNDLFDHIEKLRKSAKRNYNGNDLEQLERICNDYEHSINRAAVLYQRNYITAFEAIEKMCGYCKSFTIEYNDTVIQAERNKQKIT